MKNKIAIIIGGTSGIGRVTAENLLENGAEVHIVGRSVDKVPDQANLHKHRADITDASQVDTLVEEIGKLDHIDYLVNSSGIFAPKPFLDHTPDDYNAYLDLNKGFFFLTQSIAKKMKEQNGGSIVNVGSMWAKQAIKATPSSAYSMQKAGLHALTQHLAMELADYNIRVNAVCPTIIETPMTQKSIDADNGVLEMIKATIPMKRFGQPEEVAQVIGWLCSAESSFVNGQEVRVDGGMRA